MNVPKKGDRVECLHSWYDAAFTEAVEKGRVYVVEEVEEDCDPGCELHGETCAAPGLRLRGLPRAWWCAEQFRVRAGAA